jgi:hypothetical protein
MKIYWKFTTSLKWLLSLHLNMWISDCSNASESITNIVGVLGELVCIFQDSSINYNKCS